MEPRVRALVNAQKSLVAALVNEAERLYEAGDEEQAGLALYRAERGFPKNKKFRKLMQEAHYQRLVQKTEAIYLADNRSEEHTSELQSRGHLVCRLLLEKKQY